MEILLRPSFLPEKEEEGDDGTERESEIDCGVADFCLFHCVIHFRTAKLTVVRKGYVIIDIVVGPASGNVLVRSGKCIILILFISNRKQLLRNTTLFGDIFIKMSVILIFHIISDTFNIL